MKKRISVLLTVVVLILFVLSGCGTNKTQSNSLDVKFSENMSVADKAITTSGSNGVGTTFTGESNRAGASTTAGSEAPKEDGTAAGITGGGDISQNISNAILSERKVIRSANISVEVEDFDKADGEINTIILGIGYVQSKNINSEKYNINNVEKLVRRGTIVIRVDKDKFDKVLKSLKGIGQVFSESINGEDVTDKFYDTESRLRLLKIEESKLEEYLKKLNDLDQIFKTESRLTEIRYQIESLTGTLKKMSDLVDLSTITININEKYPGSNEPPKPKTYGQKLWDNFSESMKGVISFVGDFFIILAAAIPVLVMLGLFVLLGILIYKRIPKKKSQGVKGHMAETREKDEEIKN